ncbi:DNRLRE domain-containing protein [Krasilnikovia sp. M28-CT-15]|uniref:CBM96 family carbohydrate-binding protein n=1 Tax=Krasilnikovia sp. M28-CT-15 TaxID=3373540 RepID=UPI003876A98D
MSRRNLQKSVAALGAVLAVTGAALAAPMTTNAAAAGTLTAAGKELKLAATDDTYTSSARRTTVFGQDDKVAVGRLGKDTKVGFLKFVVPAGTRVTGAKLRLAADNVPAGTVTVRRVTNTGWTERKLSAATAPALGAIVGTARATGKQLSIDLSKVVTKPGTYAFALSSKAAVTRIRSTEHHADAPQLTVTTAVTPLTPVPPPVVSPECVTDALLVPTCGVLWGAAAGGFTSAPRDQALKDWEALSGRTAAIFHTYHKGDEQFPTKAEIAMTQDPAHPRVLLLNWKVAYGTTWAKVAAGQQDTRIDNWSKYVKANYQQKFYLALHHEPENDVNPTAGSGMTAKDYANMYRHVIERLRANGVANAVNVVAYMGNEKWMAQSWWKDLYPGDDVVDWIGLDSYVSAEKGYYHYGDFADLLDRKPTGGGQGWYDWATTQHASKPIMVAEWGVYHRVGKLTDKAPGYNSVLPELAKRPAIKAIVYFDTAKDNEGDRDISINSTASSLSAFKSLAADKIFDVKIA